MIKHFVAEAMTVVDAGTVARREDLRLDFPWIFGEHIAVNSEIIQCDVEFGGGDDLGFAIKRMSPNNSDRVESVRAEQETHLGLTTACWNAKHNPSAGRDNTRDLAYEEIESITMQIGHDVTIGDDHRDTEIRRGEPIFKRRIMRIGLHERPSGSCDSGKQGVRRLRVLS
jgi:hypothetical protein